ncbi:MAG: hypothetical protein WBJ58_11550, partial [Syntrophales bacterium]
MNLFDLTGKKGLVIGGEGNLGPIWMETLRDAGAHAYSIGLPYFDFTNDEDLRRAPEIVLQAVGTPDIIVCNA